MRFKIDENLPVEVAEALRDLGHEADTVEDEGLAGAVDQAIVAAARIDARILLTLDQGLADSVRFPAATHAGLVLFRPGSLGRKKVVDYVLSRLPALVRLNLSERVTVVTDERIRVR